MIGAVPAEPPPFQIFISVTRYIVWKFSPVASGVTRGGGKKEEVRGGGLLHVSAPANVCQGIIRLAESKKLCTTHPSVCEYKATHAWKRVELGVNGLACYPTTKIRWKL
jgi:hypothetical protein